MNTKILAVTLGLLSAFAAPAMAVPITGTIGMSGAFQAENNGGQIVTFSNATTLDFKPYNDGNNNPLPTGTGTFRTSAATSGDFDTLIGENVAGIIKDLKFANFSTPISTFWTVSNNGNTASFDLASLVINVQSDATIGLTGRGTIYLTGYDATPGTWSFSGNTNGTSSTGQFTWSADAAATAVPEPVSIALLGSALMGLGLVRRVSRKG